MSLVSVKTMEYDICHIYHMFGTYIGPISQNINLELKSTLLYFFVSSCIL